MRPRSLIVASILAFSLIACGPKSSQAQFTGYIAQQTVVESFSVSAGTPTPLAYITLANYGQGGHSISYTWTTGGHACVLALQVSGDGVLWTDIAYGPALENIGIVPSNVTYANGYFPFLRIAVNPNSDVGCLSGVTGNYVGYQFPIAIPDRSTNVTKSNIAAAQDIPGSITTASFEPVLNSFQCYNPNGATAYFQILTGALGSTIIYQIGIPQGQTFSYTGPPLSIPVLNWTAGAATLADGAVAVGTGCVCNFQLNPFGPVLPSGG